MMERFAHLGFEVEARCGAIFETIEEVDLGEWMAWRGFSPQIHGGEVQLVDAGGLKTKTPRHYRLVSNGVPVTILPGETSRPHAAEGEELAEFTRLLVSVMDRFQPEIVVNYGGDELARQVRALARSRGAAVVFALHNLSYRGAEPFQTADAVIVPSMFAAEYYGETLGLDCVHLSNLVDPVRVCAVERDPRHVTFVNPSLEKGVFAFARIADELGRRRPDIPLLVVEGRGTEATLAACGLDLRTHGTVSLMTHTHDPRMFWGVTRICLMPSLCLEAQGLVAVEAMANGVPVVASDRGALPETIGGAGVILPLPARLTPGNELLPTAEEVAPWVEAVIRLWDNPELRAEQSRKAASEFRRWDSESLDSQHARFFSELRPGGALDVGGAKHGAINRGSRLVRWGVGW